MGISQTGIRRQMLEMAEFLATDCTITNFSNKTITSDTTITPPCNINIKNVSVKNNAKLIIDVPNNITIESDFEVELGSELEIK